MLTRIRLTGGLHGARRQLDEPNSHFSLAVTGERVNQCFRGRAAFSTMAQEVENELQTVQLFNSSCSAAATLSAGEVASTKGPRHNSDQCCRTDRDRPNIQGLISGGRGLKLLKSRQHCCS